MNERHRYLSNLKVRFRFINEKLEVINKLESAAKIKIALGFVLRKVETGEYWYYYALEKKLCSKNRVYFVRKLT